MAKNKTTETEVNPREFLSAIPDENRRQDCLDLLLIMEKATRYAPKMWGPSIVGFGSYHYKYDSGHEGDAPLAGFASRSNGIVLYLTGKEPEYSARLEKLGKHKLSKSCIYIKKLSDIRPDVLTELIQGSVAYHHC